MKKAALFFIPVFLLLCMPSSGADDVRKPAVSGAFYPADKNELAEKVDGFLSNVPGGDNKERPLALIVPHAGYEYSGQVAAYGFSRIKNMRFKKVIIISPSHYAGFNGMSVYNKGAFETPLGKVYIDEDLAGKIMEQSPRFMFYPEAHRREHAIEVELPFLQRIYKGAGFKIVPIVMGVPQAEDAGILAKALENVLDKDTLIIVSVDLSHYYPYEKAVELDTNAITAIEKLDPEWFLAQLNRGELDIDAPAAVLAMLIFAGKHNAKAKILKYANSGDVTGDKSRVVGYSSSLIYVPEENSSEKGAETMEQAYLNPQERKKLLEIARASIIEAVTKRPQSYPEVEEKHLIQNCGAFVTIKEEGELRGCIGYIQAVKPLYETVKEMAQSAAINDNRFSPLTEDEFDKIDLEISVLTPMRLIKDVKEIIVGRHGIYIKKGFNSGLLLPQVAEEYGWDRDTFLKHTCIKAGLPENAWKDSSSQIYIFSAEIFGEDDK